MCGLYGVYSTTLSDGEKADATMLGWLNLHRGMDSTGIMVGRQEKGRKIIDSAKRVDHATNFFRMKGVQDLVDKKNAFLIAGHNRSATIGDINMFNTHPIRMGDIIGQHNGTINSLSKMAYDKDVSDSRLFFEMISEMGLEKAIQELRFGDAFALVYVDVKENTLNFVRNTHRPLSLMFSCAKSSLWWSSEERALQFLACGRGKSFFNAPLELPENMLLKFDLGTMKYEEVPLETIKRTIFPPLRDQSTPSTPAPWDDGEWEGWDQAFRSRERFPSLHALAEEEHRDQQARKRSSKAKDAGIYIGFEENPIQLQIAEKILRRGCSHCGEPADINDTVWWVDHETFICEENDCINDPLLKEWVGNKHMYLGKVE